MAGTRQYRRNSNGRFAGSGGGTVTTTGRSGGFASATHRANVAGKRAATAHRRALVRKGVKYTAAVGGGALAIKAISAATGNSKRSKTRTLADIIKHDVKNNPIGDIANLRTAAGRS